MAYPTAVNDQITDAVTQTNVKVTGESPAQAMADIYQNEAEQAESEVSEQKAEE